MVSEPRDLFVWEERWIMAGDDRTFSEFVADDGRPQVAVNIDWIPGTFEQLSPGLKIVTIAGTDSTGCR